jgi:hypothetical protein
MIRYTSSKQMTLEGFTLPFIGQLNPKNRWVKWSEVVPWDGLAIGALIVKRKLNLSDEETVMQIQENPYLQYFVGFSCYKDEPPFSPSLFVEIRKRMGEDVFASFEKVILEKIGKSRPASAAPPENRGKLLVDATVAEQSVKYPTDISLLNKAREISEKLIDVLYALSDYNTNPRTYRQKARRLYLVLAKNKKPSWKVRQRGIREWLQYLRRNLGYISVLLDDVGSMFPLPYKFQRQYWIIQCVYEQQDGMYKDRRSRCDNRIISISQPHARPIVRDKAGKRRSLVRK